MIVNLPPEADLLTGVVVPAGAIQRLERAGWRAVWAPPLTLGDCDVGALRILAAIRAVTPDGQRFVSQAAGMLAIVIEATYGRPCSSLCSPAEGRCVVTPDGVCDVTGLGPLQ